jgi:DNA-binding transcriptional ArsR family regulator
MVDYYPADANLDAAFAALADPTRRQVVGRLALLPPGTAVPVSALAAPYPISLQAGSKHLLVLERAGLITCQKSGRVRRCCLLPTPLRDLSAWIESHRSF